MLWYLFLIAIGAFIFRVFFYPYTISEEVFEFETIEALDDENIRFISHGDMITRNVKDRWIIRGINQGKNHFIKFRQCGLLYNHKKYDVVLISTPEDDF